MPENTVAYALADFDRFRKKSEPQASQSAFALGLELSGLLLALRDGPGDLTQASQTLREAAALEPDSGAIRNLSACVQIWQEWKSARLGAHAKAQADQLIAATVLDSHSGTNLSNLRALYQLLLNTPQASLEPAISREELQRRLQKIDAAKSPLDN